MGLPKYPKILPLGHRVIDKIYDGVCELTEKVDGSQFRFGIIDNDLACGTKRTRLDLDNPDHLFRPAVAHMKKVAHRLPTNVFFFGETLAKPKHNTLRYNEVPKNHIALFAGMKPDTSMISYEELSDWADILDVDVVPILFRGIVSGPDQIIDLLHTESYLGGPKIEGVVAKNYSHSAMIDDNNYYPYLVGKYVSEDFKEQHVKDWKKGTRKQTLMEFFQSFQTEARWKKAIQHLRDDGKLTGEPKDIGPLIKELTQDFLDEESEIIMDRLWQEYKKQAIHFVIKGFPEWYKQQILTGGIDMGGINVK
jgi:hypothetical protein